MSEFKSDLKINSAEKCCELFKRLFQKLKFNVEKCHTRQSIAFALMDRSFDLEIYKGIDPNSAYIIKTMLNAIKNYVKQNEFEMFNCSTFKFQYFLKKVMIIY